MEELDPKQLAANAAKALLARRKLRKRCQNDLLEFIKHTHPSWETGQHHVIMCKWLMRLESDDHPEVQNVAVFAPPRHGKTEIVSRRFPAWCYGRRAGWQMICVQKNDRLAQDTGADVRDIVNSPEYKEIFPNVSLKQDAKAAGRWMVGHEGRNDIGVYFASGIGGTIIGRGANLLNIDDPLDGEGAASPRQREIASNFYYGDAIQRLMEPRLQLFTTTRRHEDDLAGRVVPPEDTWEATDEEFVFRAQTAPRDYSDPVVWWIIQLPAIIDEGEDTERALWPGDDNKRFPLPFLKTQRAQIFRKGTPREWYCQYQQIITPEEGNYCKRKWFEERYDEENLPPDLWIYASSDVAVTQERHGADPDFTEHGIFGLEGLQLEYDDKGNLLATVDTIYVLDWWFGRKTPDQWIAEQIRLIKKWKPQVWFGTKGVIRNAIEGYLEREIRQKRAYVQLEWLSDVKEKAAKGRALQGLAASGRILFPKKDWAERVIVNLCTFPNAKHDDAFDTMANIARSLGEIPDAYMGAPYAAMKSQNTGVYEFFDTNKKSKTWKCV